jgi:uncharacterized protein (TIGR02594 family)
MLSLLLIAILFLVVVATVLGAGTTAAEARGRHHHHHAHHRHHARSAPAPTVERTPSFWESVTSVTGDTSRVSVARRYLGSTASQLGLPRRLWCADFVNMVERSLGRSGTGSRMALSFERSGHRLAGPAVGAIATMGRRGGGHVGIVTGVTAAGDPIIISGNHGRMVREAVYPRDRIRGYWT